MPTKTDLTTYQNMIRNVVTKTDEENNIHKAYKYFEQQLKTLLLDEEKLLRRMIGLFSVVVIQLADEDNPFLVFEGLNFKGKQLSEADLIRNYIFMQLDKNDRDAVYTQYWRPMQERLVQIVKEQRDDQMTNFIRHNLMRSGKEVKTSAVYSELKKSLKEERISTKEYVKELEIFSHYYEKLIYPEKETDHEIRACLKRLNRINIKVIYPFLLSLYQKYTVKEVSKSDFIESLKTIENFLVRRIVCQYKSNQLTKIFLSVISEIEENFPNDFLQGLKICLSNNNKKKGLSFTIYG